MILDFAQMDEQIDEHFKGGEKAFASKRYADDLNRILRGRLVPGASVGLHTHEGDCEIIYILSGTGKALMDDGSEEVRPGVCHYCPKGHRHSLINTGTEDLVFFAVIPKQ